MKDGYNMGKMSAAFSTQTSEVPTQREPKGTLKLLLYFVQSRAFRVS